MTDTKLSDRPFYLWPFYVIWSGFTFLKKLIINAFFLSVIAFVLFAIFGQSKPKTPEQAPLWLAPQGFLVDQYSYRAPSALLLDPSLDSIAETRVKDLVDMIDKAADDSSITGLVLQLDYLQGAGMSKMQEVGKAIERFQAANKPVIAFGDTFSQAQYFLAAYADEIVLNNLGTIELTGFGVYRNYYKEAIDKLALTVNVFKVGQYKDFIEPYTRSSMSDASREHNSAWISTLWSKYTKHIEAKRVLEPGSLDALISALPERLRSTNGDAATLALQAKLVDRVGSRRDLYTALRDRFGEPSLPEDVFLHIGAHHYPHPSPLKKLPDTSQIGLIVASGMILDGYQPEGSIGSESLSELIRKAREDDSIKALVLRIDSGGGSAFASEVIREELEATRESGLPVVVSMGSVAASGGYWIAMAADEVWATPSTITGSIGVFGMLPTAEKSLAKIGISTDGIGTTPLAGAGRIDRALPKPAADLIQQSVETIYQRFINLVAESRQLTVENVHDIAQGRVWTGSKALELGLVDQLGYLENAVEAAARLAQLENSSVKLIERERTPAEQLMLTLREQGVTTFGNQSPFEVQSLQTRSGLFNMLLSLEKTLGISAQPWSTQQKRGIYAWCLPCESNAVN